MSELLNDHVTERQVQNVVLEMASLFGWLSYHTYDSRRSQPGFPDLVLVRPPRVIFAELKNERGRLTTGQIEWRDQLLASGAEWYLWRPSDLTAVAQILGTERSVWTGASSPPSDVE